MATTAKTRAAKKAPPARYIGKPFCSTPPRPQPPLPAAVAADPRRARAILDTRSKWLNRTVLHYCFFTRQLPLRRAQGAGRRRSASAFAEWKAPGHRPRVPGSAVSSAKPRFASATRRPTAARPRRSAATCCSVPLNEPTTRRTAGTCTTPYGQRHRAPRARARARHGARAPESVRRHQAGTSRRSTTRSAQPPEQLGRAPTTFHNILEKLSTQRVSRVRRGIPDSIMEYEFEPGLIDEPEEYDLNGLAPPGTLSAADKQWARDLVPGCCAAADDAGALPGGGRRPRGRTAGRLRDQARRHRAGTRSDHTGASRHLARPVRGRRRRAALPGRRRRQRRGPQRRASDTSCSRASTCAPYDCGSTTPERRARRRW